MEVKFLLIDGFKKQEIDCAMQTNLSHIDNLQDFRGMLTGLISPAFNKAINFIVRAASFPENYKRRLGMNIYFQNSIRSTRQT